MKNKIRIGLVTLFVAVATGRAQTFYYKTNNLTAPPIAPTSR